LPARAERLKCDVIFCPTGLVALRGHTPMVMTVYDLTPLRYAHTQDWLSRQYILAMMRAGIRRAARVCTISRAVGAELRDRFPRLAADRLVVTYPGPNPELIGAEARPAPVPDRPFLLMVGTVEPRKNHITALRALAEHRRRHPASSLMLVAAGSAGWHYAPTLRAIDELGLQQHVVRLGATSPATLKWLYQRATALLFPSLYEGFGLPVLEALYLGCPVIASDIPSVAEIIGGRERLLPPTDVPAWTAAIDALPVTPARDQREVDDGIERARRFTWEACATSAVGAISAARGR
jgi:glycosyltransferase involved in cell wall biosynthesis